MEGWGPELCVIHVARMWCSYCMLVVLLDDWVEKTTKSSVRVLAAGVDANARVNILAS